jgi:hypothetical protein
VICLCHHYAHSGGFYNYPSIWFLLFCFNGFPGISCLYKHIHEALPVKKWYVIIQSSSKFSVRYLIIDDALPVK